MGVLDKLKQTKESMEARKVPPNTEDPANVNPNTQTPPVADPPMPPAEKPAAEVVPPVTDPNAQPPVEKPAVEKPVTEEGDTGLPADIDMTEFLGGDDKPPVPDPNTQAQVQATTFDFSSLSEQTGMEGITNTETLVSAIKSLQAKEERARQVLGLGEEVTNAILDGEISLREVVNMELDTDFRDALRSDSGRRALAADSLAALYGDDQEQINERLDDMTDSEIRAKAENHVAMLTDKRNQMVKSLKEKSALDQAKNSARQDTTADDAKYNQAVKTTLSSMADVDGVPLKENHIQALEVLLTNPKALEKALYGKGVENLAKVLFRGLFPGSYVKDLQNIGANGATRKIIDGAKNIQTVPPGVRPQGGGSTFKEKAAAFRQSKGR